MPKPDPESFAVSRFRGLRSAPWWIPAGILVAVIASYAATFRVPLLLDDDYSITGNPSIRSLLALDRVFSAPPAAPTAGRPFANLTFAVNYAVSGLDPWSYHALNLGIHLLAVLALFGVVRRTLRGGRAEVGLGVGADEVAGAIALLWGVHPLATQSVTYLSQRTELLMGLCYLLTLYGFIRAREERPRFWQGVSVAACLLGALSKEVIVTAPVMVLLYDRAFAAGSIRSALRERRGYYAGLAATWLVVAWLLLDVRSRGVGFGLGIPWWEYALTQCRAVLVYLGLGLWPHPLIFDRGSPLMTSWSEAGVPAVVMAGLIGGSAWAWWRHPRVGFCAVGFLLMLAPASSVVPVAGATIAENRVYLPLAAVVALGVLGVQRVLGLRGARAACLLLVAAAMGATIERNRDFRSDVGLWTDTVRKAPDNPRAHHNLALLLARDPSRREEALVHYGRALSLKPDYAEAHRNLGDLLSAMPGRQAEAIEHYEEALRLRADVAEAHYNLARLLAAQASRQGEALDHYQEALRLRPGFAEAHNNLGNLLGRMPGRQEEASGHYAEALRLRAGYAEAHHNLAVLLARLPGREAEALAHAREAVRLRPDNPAVRANLARQLERFPDRREEAEAHYREALRLDPGMTVAREGLDRLRR